MPGTITGPDVSFGPRTEVAVATEIAEPDRRIADAPAVGMTALELLESGYDPTRTVLNGPNIVSRPDPVVRLLQRAIELEQADPQAPGHL